MTTDEALNAAIATLNEFYAERPKTTGEAMFLESRLRNLSCVLRTARKAIADLTEQLMEER